MTQERQAPVGDLAAVAVVPLEAARPRGHDGRAQPAVARAPGRAAHGQPGHDEVPLPGADGRPEGPLHELGAVGGAERRQNHRQMRRLHALADRSGVGELRKADGAGRRRGEEEGQAVLVVDRLDLARLTDQGVLAVILDAHHVQ
ncbi:hypothetical protein [Streptomyces sp. NPDC058268]|uniref:hypothetical protein n=1 Tax=Streptomyces sp. NPDC058268 TaxID=3346413 RepID=UPI0036E88D1B